MSLREDFYTFMNKYADELNEARSSEDYKRPFGAFVRQEIAGVIRSHEDMICLAGRNR